jgi:adenylate cyclase
VIGDPVNIAARVERLTRETGDAVLVAEATRCLLSDGHFKLESRGDFALKGVAEPVPIYALSPSLDESSSRPQKASQARA